MILYPGLRMIEDGRNYSVKFLLVLLHLKTDEFNMKFLWFVCQLVYTTLGKVSGQAFPKNFKIKYI